MPEPAPSPVHRTPQAMVMHQIFIIAVVMIIMIIMNIITLMLIVSLGHLCPRCPISPGERVGETTKTHCLWGGTKKQLNTISFYPDGNP